MANLRLGSGTLSALARPNFSAAAGSAIGLGMLGAEKRREAAEVRDTEEITLELLRKSQVAQEQGDMRLLNEVNATLDGMLTGNTNEKSRQLITRGMTTVGGQRAATQKKQQTNTAMSILKTEEALQQFANDTTPLTNEEYAQRAKVQGALESQLAKMKQNGAAVTEAASIQYNTDLTGLERDIELREKRVSVAENLLASVDKDSPEYDRLVNRFEAEGLGQAVINHKTKMQTLEKGRLEITKLESEVGPLSKEEMAQAKELGLSITDASSPLSRKLFNAARIVQVKQETEIALRSTNTPEKTRAEAIVRAQLKAISRQGDYVDFIYNRDIDTKISNMTDEEVDDLMGRVAGLSEGEIGSEVNAWLRENFPDAMRRSIAFNEKNKIEAEEIGSLTNSILKGKGISIADATEKQRAVAQREAELALAGAEAALGRKDKTPKEEILYRREPGMPFLSDAYQRGVENLEEYKRNMRSRRAPQPTEES